jgi:hypothetical protein
MQRFFRWLMMLCLTGAALEAASWEYRISSPLFGRLGSVQIRETNVSGRGYRIEAEAKTRGIAATLTRHRHWQVLSEGTVRRSGRHSRHYRYLTEDRKRKKVHDYTIDPAHKKVTRETREWKKGRLKKTERVKLSYYIDRDLATLLFDLLSHPQALKSGRYRAVGAEKKGGWVSVTVPEEKRAASERSRLGVGKEDRILYILVPKKGEKTRKIVAAIAPEGRLDAAYTVAVPIIGVLYMKRR